MAFTSGRSKVLPATTNTVSAAAWATMSAPAHAPTPADPQSVAAVFRPRTFMPSFHDDAGAEEADPRDHIGDHMHRAFGSLQGHRKIDKGRRTDGNQHIGSQARGPLPVLPLRADQGAQHKGRGQADQRVEEIDDLEGGQEAQWISGQRDDGPITA